MGANGAGAGHAGGTGEVPSRVPADGSVPGGGGSRVAPLRQTGFPFRRESRGEPGGGGSAGVVPSPRQRRRGRGFLLAVPSLRGWGLSPAAQGQRRLLPPTLRRRFVPLAPWEDDTWLLPRGFLPSPRRGRARVGNELPPLTRGVPRAPASLYRPPLYSPPGSRASLLLRRSLAPLCGRSPWRSFAGCRFWSRRGDFGVCPGCPCPSVSPP